MTVQMTPGTMRLAIVDDHELLLDGLTTWVTKNAPDLKVIASVTSWFDLIRDEEFPPDVTVMDFQLKEPVSIETRIRTCRAAGSQVVVVSALESPQVRDRVLAAGAAAFVPKSRPAEDVVDAVRRVLAGGDAVPTAPDEEDCPAACPFTDDVLETLRLYANGESPIDIAVSRHMTIDVVRSHLSGMRDHYVTEGRSAGTRQELILRAAEDGYLL
jgi:DNA-binding NarL/FixJ family response regulator